MKKIFFFIASLLFSFCSNAQVKTVFYVGDQVVSDSTMATSFAVYGKLTNEDLYTFKRFDIYNNLLTTGSFKDENLTIAHGHFVYYTEVELFNDIYFTSYPSNIKNMFKSEEGSFDNGLSVGKWVSYYPDGKLFTVVNFVNGLKEGKYISYDNKGIIKVMGNFVADKKEGEWLFKRGRKKEYYENDVKVKRKDKN